MKKLINFDRYEIDFNQILLEFIAPYMQNDVDDEYLNDRNFASTLSWFNRQELVSLIVTYKQLNGIMIEYSTALDEYKFTIYDLITKIIRNKFLRDLSKIESSISNTSLCNFNELFAYNPLFNDMLRTISINQSSCQTLFELISILYQRHTSIIIDLRLEYDPFYQQIFTWITRGKLMNNLLNFNANNFFIQESQTDSNTLLDLSLKPEQIDENNVIKIFDIGQLIKKILKIKSKDIRFFDSNLYWYYYDKRMELYNFSVLFRYFLDDLSNKIFKFIMNETSLKTDTIDMIRHMNTLYLHESELLWINFYELKFLKHTASDCSVRKLFIQSLCRTFDYDHVEANFLPFISIKERNLDNSSSSINQSIPLENSFIITFRLPPIIKIIITDKIIEKYHQIFVYLQKFKLIHWQLIQAWKSKMTSSDDIQSICRFQYYHILSLLIRFVNTVYTYFKLSINYYMNEFFSKINALDNINGIQQLLLSTLLSIMNDLLMTNTFYYKLINRILDLGKQLLSLKMVNNQNSRDNLQTLLNDYNQAMNIFRETINLNLNNRIRTKFNEFLFNI